MHPKCYKRMGKVWIADAKKRVKEAKGSKNRLIALFLLWREREYFSTLVNHIICWWTLNDKVVAGAILHQDYALFCEEDRIKEFVRVHLGTKVSKRALELVQDIQSDQADIEWAQKKVVDELEEKDKIKRLEVRVRELESFTREIARKVSKGNKYGSSSLEIQGG